jgi:PHP family Zn ribbon phosphoesterase
MKEYIERAPLIKQFSGGDEMKSMSESIHDSRFVEALKSAPVVDVAPIVHGEWRVSAENSRRRLIECSHCEAKFVLDNSETNPNYCPDCGAKMTKEN